jgi:hypothetical protein
MANEKSRNHEPRGGNKGGNGQTQGKPDSDKQSTAGSKRSADSASRKPGPGKQPRDQLTVRNATSSETPGK